MQKFFLYARKSTDVEDKQVLSIEAQLTELRSFAREQGLEVVEELIEKQSAKIPGRPVFGQMLRRIERGEANGVVSWHPDRLARNSVDGGQIIYFLDIGLLVNLKFPSHWFENTPQGKFTLSMAFVQSKYYVDSLSENTKRGLRQKVRNGDYPSQAPVGYINDSRTKSIVIDKKKAKVLRLAFELYAKGESRLEDIANFLAKNNIKTRSGKILHKSRVSFVLSNQFYIGLFKYGGERHEGKYKPIISKKLFDSVQVMLKQKGRPERKSKNDPQPFCGLLSCTECGMMITGEYKVKKQKNGNVHEYIYYHCTKKNKSVKCSQPCIRQEELDRQLSSFITSVSLPKDWSDYFIQKLEKDKIKSTQSLTACVKENQAKIFSINQKLERLLNGYLDQIIEQEIYRVQKAKLLSEKKSLEEKIFTLSHKQNAWLEPMQEWIKTAQSIDGIARDTDLFAKKVCAKEIFGSNLLLQNKTVRASAPNILNSAGENQWALLRNAHHLALKKPFSSFKVPEVGLEPTRLTTGNFKSPMSTISSLGQKLSNEFEAWAGIEPAHGGFADRSVTTSPPRQ